MFKPSREISIIAEARSLARSFLYFCRVARGRDTDVVTNPQEPHRKDLKSRVPNCGIKLTACTRVKRKRSKEHKAMTKTNVHYRKLTSVKTKDRYMVHNTSALL
jgi:hypothetical protein